MLAEDEHNVPLSPGVLDRGFFYGIVQGMLKRMQQANSQGAPAGLQLGFQTDLFDLLAQGNDLPRKLKIFPYGEWDNPAYGHWRIDKSVGEDFARNWRERVYRRDIGFDLRHEDGASPAWITNVIAEDDGVYVEVEWTKLGEELVGSKQYRYVSPSWYWDWVRPDDKARFKHVLTGVALTNDPFFRELPALDSQATAKPRILVGMRATAPDTSGVEAPMGENEQNTTPETVAENPGVAATLGAASEQAPGPGGPQAPATTPATAGADTARMTALEQQLAEANKRLALAEAEQAAMRRREARATSGEALRAALATARPGHLVPPTLVEQWAEHLADASDVAPAVQAGQNAADVKSPRQALLDLIVATARTFPASGEVGMNAEPPTSGEGLSAEAKSRELDRLAQAKLGEDKGSDAYAAAVKDVLKERPDLRG